MNILLTFILKMNWGHLLDNNDIMIDISLSTKTRLIKRNYPIKYNKGLILL
jgi:hypothetical protein